MHLNFYQERSVLTTTAANAATAARAAGGARAASAANAASAASSTFKQPILK